MICSSVDVRAGGAAHAALLRACGRHEARAQGSCGGRTDAETVVVRFCWHADDHADSFLAPQAATAQIGIIGPPISAAFEPPSVPGMADLTQARVPCSRPWPRRCSATNVGA